MLDISIFQLVVSPATLQPSNYVGDFCALKLPNYRIKKKKKK